VCRSLSENDDRANQVVLRCEHAAVMLNRYPYNNGHLLIIPRAHKSRLDQLTTEELLDVHISMRRMIAVIEKLMKPDGFNIGLNMGKAAGAGLPGHLHWHVVPRWDGDTNFMPVVAGIKVIAQSLDALYQSLTEELGASSDE
jgi:ATP adenylyltransferase